MKVDKYTLDDARNFQEKYKEIKKQYGKDESRAMVRNYFADPRKIALFAYVVLPHYFNRNFKDVHYKLLNHIEIGKRHKKNKGTMMYRGGGKTSIELVLQEIYEACYNVFQFSVINSYNSTMAIDKLRLLKEEFESNEFIRYFYGEPIGEKEYWNKQDLTAWGRNRFVALSTRENPKGLLSKGDRPQKILSDDILSAVDVRSIEQREIAMQWYKGALMECLAADGVLEILNTPLHPDDIIMTIFKGEPPFHVDWDVLKLPAMVNGKTVDADWKTTKELNEKAKDEYTFQQEMMCNPLKIDSGVIKFDDLRFYDELPEIISASMHADTTHTGKTTSDYFALGIIGQSEDNYYYLIDYILEKCTVDKQAQYLIDFYLRYYEQLGIPINNITFDEKANQGFGYWVKKLAVEEHDLSLPLTELNCPLDKVKHFEPHIPHFRSNRILLPKNHSGNKILLDQLLAFPQKGVHDDAVDMFSGCLDYFHAPVPSVF